VTLWTLKKLEPILVEDRKRGLGDRKEGEEEMVVLEAHFLSISGIYRFLYSGISIPFPTLFELAFDDSTTSTKNWVTTLIF